MNEPRAQNQSNDASSKKPVQRKRHKQTGRYSELFVMSIGCILHV